MIKSEISRYVANGNLPGSFYLFCRHKHQKAQTGTLQNGMTRFFISFL
jgi:hypothetical protein